MSTPSPRWARRPIIVAIPTSSGTGSEVTPFAIITDEETGIKWPLADYELHAQHGHRGRRQHDDSAPKGLTCCFRYRRYDPRHRGLRLHHGHSDFTDGLALKAMKARVRLPACAPTRMAPTIPYARERDGRRLLHGRYGFRQRLPGRQPLHGSQAGRLTITCPTALPTPVILTDVMRYNAAEVPAKMGTFSQYQYPHALSALRGSCGRYCGITGARTTTRCSRTSSRSSGGPEGDDRHQEDHHAITASTRSTSWIPWTRWWRTPSTTSAPAPTPATR